MKTLIAAMTLTFAAANVAAQCTDYAWRDVLVTTTDFSSGSTSVLDHFKAPTLNVESISSDAVVRQSGQLVYVVNRGSSGNIQILVPCTGYATLDQWSTGGGSNPHDIVVLPPGDVGYITRYDMTSVLKMNLQTGATLATISLATFADADGLPEMDQMFVYGDRLYVGLQRLDRNNFYSPVGTSYLAVIDLNTDTLVDMNPGAGGIQGITLLRTNPYSEMSLHFGATEFAYFSAVGFFGVLDGGVIACDVNNPATQSVILTENAAGGDVLDVEIVSDTKGFAIVANPSFETILIAFDPSTGLKLGATMYASGGYDLNDIEPSPGGLLLGDRKVTNPGVRCFDMDTHAQIPGGPINVGLPPFDILVSTDWVTGIGDSPGIARLGQNYPNPFNPETSIPFSLAREARVTLRVYDVSGAHVATLLDENREAGEYTARWDGRDAQGRVSASGVYFVRLEANGTIATRKLVLLK